MSFQAMAKAVKLKTEKPTDKLVLLMLANFADENNQAYPSYKRLAEDCCMTERGIKAIMGRLRKEGYVTWVKRKKKPDDENCREYTSNLYTLHLDEPAPPENKGSEFHAPPQHGQNGGSEPRSPGVVNDVHQGSEPRSLKPIIETSSSKPADTGFDFDLVLAWIINQMTTVHQLTDLDRMFIEASLHDYLDSAEKPRRAQAFSWTETALQNRLRSFQRTAKTSAARDELNESHKNLIRAQTDIVNQHTRTMEMKTGGHRNDTSWAVGLDE